MPTSNSSSSRPGSSWSVTTRAQIAPTVCQATRTSRRTAVLSILVASHATRSSKSRVKPDSTLANGTPSVRTPWVGQSIRRSLALTTPQAAKVQVPPAGVDRAGVVAGPAGVGAVRAGEPAAAQRDRDGDLRRLERDVAHRGTRKGEQAVECSSDAHGRWTSGLGLGHLQPYGLACARHPSRSQHLVGVVLPASPSAKDPRRTHIQFRSPGFVYSPGLARFAVTQMRQLGIVDNGHDATLEIG